MAQTAFSGVCFLTPVIRMTTGGKNLRQELLRVLKPYGITSTEATAAIKAAEKAQDVFIDSIKKKGREVLAGIKERAFVIVGRAYNSFDRGMNLDIPKKIADLGTIAIPMDFLPLEDVAIGKTWPNMYWRAGQRILSAARIIASDPVLEAIYIGNFSCGPDSFIMKFFEEEMTGKSFLHLELDAHSADAGAITRCEAFLDSVRGRTNGSRSHQGRQKKRSAYDDKAVSRSAKRTIFIPRMSDHAFALAAAFSYCGVDAEVLPESSKQSVDLAKRFVSGKECYPCAVTTGDMLRKIMAPGFDPDRSAFFMPSGSGPCRFGQYNIFQRMVIRDLGIDNLPIFSPNQDENFYKYLGLIGKQYAMRAWEGVVAVSLLEKCLHQTRPYEMEPGATDRVYAKYLAVVSDALRSRQGVISTHLTRALQDFSAIPVSREQRPLIGIVGEIFVRSNRFSNEDLVRKIEALGGEACLTPVDEWINYINLMGIRHVLIKKDLSGMITLLFKRFFQKRIEKRQGKLFSGFLRSLHEPDTRALLRNASPYVHPSFEGETILSIGKSIDLAQKGASGIISVLPFGCMPGTIVNALMRGVRNEYDIPHLSIPYDGTQSLTTEIQLEAFIDQAGQYKAVASQASRIMKKRR
jgi:predicted nucleotide-binding protein (sugar kinase/HSP70/actin superfamily)